MFGKFYSFSVKLNAKRWVSKKHEVNWVLFFHLFNQVNLSVHVDGRDQQIQFNLEEAEELLKQLTHSIEQLKSKNQSA